MSIHEFESAFPNDASCMGHLANLKWSNGFLCVKCGYTKYYVYAPCFTRQCNRCRHVESPTANTFFHKCKLPLRKAFLMVYIVSNTQGRVSSVELGRILSVRQKTCWFYKKKLIERANYLHSYSFYKLLDGAVYPCHRSNHVE